MEEGVIVRPNKEKKFAFIEREGKPDLHCGTRYIPDVEEGDRVSFEEATSDRGPTARKVKILQRADGSPYVPGNRKTEEPQGIGVGIEIGTPQVIEEEEKVGDTDEVIKVLRLMLPVLVSLTRGNQKVRDMEVIFEPNGVHRIRNDWDVFCTNQMGEAYSQVLAPPDTEETIVTVRVAGRNYSERWRKEIPKAEPPTEPTPTVTADASTAATEPAASEPPKPTEPPKVQKLHLVKGIYTFLIQTTPNTLVVLDSTIPVLARKLPCQETGEWSKGSFTTDDTGSLQLQVKVENEGDRGDLFFCVGTFRSSPQFVAYPSPYKKKI